MEKDIKAAIKNSTNLVERIVAYDGDKPVKSFCDAFFSFPCSNRDFAILLQLYTSEEGTSFECIDIVEKMLDSHKRKRLCCLYVDIQRVDPCDYSSMCYCSRESDCPIQRLMPCFVQLNAYRKISYIWVCKRFRRLGLGTIFVNKLEANVYREIENPQPAEFWNSFNDENQKK